MFVRVMLLSVVALAVSGLAAQNLPTIDQVLSGHGKPPGKGRLLLLQGHCDASNLEESGPFELRVASPRIAMDLNRSSLKTGFDGKQLWRQEAGQPAVGLPAGPLIEAIAIFDPDRRRRWKELYPRIAVVRDEKLGNRTVLVLETEPGAKSTMRFYVDPQESDLLRAETMPGLNFEMSDYRDVGGWRIPFHIVQSTPGGVYTFHVEKGEAVQAMDDSFFAMP